jgi:hypothetical protein
VVTAEGIASGVQRPQQQLSGEARVGAVEPQDLPPDDPHVQREVSEVGPERDQQPVRRDGHRGA